MNPLLSKGSVFTFILFLFLLDCDQLLAQVTTVGKEFWVGFMENHRQLPSPNFVGRLDIGIIVITANEASEGVIEYAGNTVTFNIQAGQQFEHRITSLDILHRTSGDIQDKGIYILSSGKISVYAFNERRFSADGTVVLPTATLGKDYYITSHFQEVTIGQNIQGLNTNNESTLLVVAIENNTEIEITPKVNTVSGQNAGVPFKISLDVGQSYQLKARGDLTGSRVRVLGSTANDCKNIAVFGGNKWTAVGDCGQANDHLFQQAYPVNTWGDEFLHVPYRGRNSGEIVKILASENNTEVTVDGLNTGTIDAGEFIQLDFNYTQTASIKGSKPISVTSFAKSMACNLPGQGANIGDPFMITYSPNQQKLREIIFNAIPLQSIEAHFINIITQSASIAKTRLDGINVGIQFTAFPTNPVFAYARINIAAGVHSLENPDGFIAYVYGFGNVESYGYAVGANLENLNFNVISNYDFEVDGEAVACLNQSAEWEINPENEIFQYFTWNFGDGSPTVEGKLVDHKFEKPGTFEVLVTASISEDSCDQQEEVRFEILVEEFLGEIIGPNSVCPDVDEIEYQFNIDKNIARIEWEVEGGVKVSENKNSIIVKWGESNPSAKVTARPINMEGCPGEVIELVVRVNNLIEPKIALGEDRICFDGSTTYQYSVAEFVNERGYEWFVLGGDIIGSDSSSAVQVNWSSPGIVGQVWYREFSLITDDCEGTSPKLEIEINKIITAEIITTTAILCFGEKTGSIELSVMGGEAPYTYVWSHDQDIDSPTVTGIPAGVYSVTITDDFGCEIMLDNIKINEPPLLEIQNINTTSTSCFGRADGESVINITGGIAPYTINLPTNQINGNQINLFDLEGRQYDLEITDANGCVLPISFIISSPLPLEVDVKIEKFSCPGEANGKLIAEPKGGNSPFEYTWEFDNSNEFLLKGVPRGTYGVTVEDSRGCVSFGLGEMLEADPIARMPTGFNPKEGLYEAISNCTLTFELIIYNRWGELVYFGNTGWDGKINDELASSDSYTYVFSFTYILNGEQKSDQIKGGFILVK